MTTRDSLGPPYVEAIPHLDVHSVMRASDAELCYHQWEDQDGLIIGHILGQEFSGERFVFTYKFFPTRNVEARTNVAEIKLTWTKTGAHWLKPSFQCPGCERDVGKIFYMRGMWRCKKCHSLLNLSQRLTPVNKAIWRKAELAEKLKARPRTPAEWRQREKYKAKNGVVARILADTHLTELPERYVYRSHGRWLAADELPKTGIAADEIGYGWLPGDAGQFDGLDTRERLAVPRFRREATRAATTASDDVSKDTRPNRTFDGGKRPHVSDLVAVHHSSPGARAEPDAEPDSTGLSRLRPIPWFGQN